MMLGMASGARLKLRLAPSTAACMSCITLLSLPCFTYGLTAARGGTVMPSSAIFRSRQSSRSPGPCICSLNSVFCSSPDTQFSAAATVLAPLLEELLWQNHMLREHVLARRETIAC